MRFLSCFLLITVSAVLVAGPADAKKSKFRMTGCWEQQQEAGFTACFYKTGIAQVFWRSGDAKGVEGFEERWRWSRNGKKLSIESDSDSGEAVCEMVPAQPVDHFSLHCRGRMSGKDPSGSWMTYSVPGYKDN